MVFKEVYADLTGSLVYLGEYHPWHGGHNPDFDEFSRKILDLKGDTATTRRNKAVAEFVGELDEMLKKRVAITVVPSHDPKHTDSGIKQIAKRLVARGRHDACDCLMRFKKIRKLAIGGDRSEKIHRESIRVVQPDLIRKKNVVILDDVTTTGNSLSACSKLLLRAGAASVQQIAIGLTQ